MGSSGLDLLDELRDRFAALSTFPEDVAKIAAPLVEEALKKTAAAGTDPLGKPWVRKKDGGAPLVHAAEHIATTAIGPVVRSTLTGPDVFHHFGAGVPRRPILPDPGTIPPGVEQALRKAVDIAFGRSAQ